MSESDIIKFPAKGSTALQSEPEAQPSGTDATVLATIVDLSERAKTETISTFAGITIIDGNATLMLSGHANCNALGAIALLLAHAQQTVLEANPS